MATIGKLKLVGEDFGLCESDIGEVKVPLPVGCECRPGVFMYFNVDPLDGAQADTQYDVWTTPSLTNNDAAPMMFPETIGRVCRCIDGGNYFVKVPGMQEDVFCHSKIARQLNQTGLRVGDLIAFEIHWSAAQKAQASAPLWRCVSKGTTLSTFDDIARSLQGQNAQSTNEPGFEQGGNSGNSGAIGAPIGGRGGFKGMMGAASIQASPHSTPQQGIGREETEELDQDFSSIRMGTVTKDKTPDGDHTVIMTLEQDMIFVEDTILQKYGLKSGVDVAVSVYQNEDGHPLVDGNYPVWQLSIPFKEDQTPYFGDFYGKVINISANGNGYVDCKVLKEKYGQDPFIHSKIMKLCQINLADTINFNVHINSSNTPQVSAPVWMKCQDQNERMMQRRAMAGAAPMMAGFGAAAGWGGGQKGRGKMDGMKGLPSRTVRMTDMVPNQMGMQMQRKRPASNEWDFAGALPGSKEEENPDLIGDYEGFLTTVNHKGNGFIKSPQFPEKDVFVHQKVMERCKLAIDDRIKFNVHISKDGTAQCSMPVWVLRSGNPPAVPKRRKF